MPVVERELLAKIDRLHGRDESKQQADEKEQGADDQAAEDVEDFEALREVDEGLIGEEEDGTDNVPEEKRGHGGGRCSHGGFLCNFFLGPLVDATKLPRFLPHLLFCKIREADGGGGSRTVAVELKDKLKL